MSGLLERLRELLARPVLANSAALIALRATNLLARLLLLFAIARQVTPAAFGTVIFVMSVAEIGKVLADFGLDTLAIREYSAPVPAARFAAGLAAAKLVFGGVVYLGLAAWFAAAGPPSQAAAGLILGATVLTSLLANYSLDYYQGRLRVARVLPAVLVTNVVLTLAALVALPHLTDLRAQVALFPLLEGAAALVLLARLRREGPVAGPPLVFGEVPALVRRSLPIAATAVVIMVYSRLDVLVLSSRLDAATVGQYGMAFRLTEPFQLAAAAFALSVFSRFATRFQSPPVTGVRALAARYLAATLGYGVVTALALALLAPPLIHRFLPGYGPCVPVLQVLAGALVFRSLNATLAGILQGAGRFRLLTGIAVWNLALVYVLLGWLVGPLGARGAAFALLGAEAVNTLVQLAMVVRTIAAQEGAPRHAG